LNGLSFELEKKNRALYGNIQRLKNDPEYIENIARTELGMVGKDELVYQFRKKE
jgi:cell division protein FtsB